MPKVDLVTEEFTASFPCLDKFEEFDGTSTNKYSVTMKFDHGSEGHKQMQAAVGEVHEGGYDPIKIGKSKFDEGQVLVKAKSGYQVPCVDQDKNEISPSQIHNGDKCRAVVTCSSWQKGSNQGTSVWLNRIQKVSSGSLGGSSLDFEAQDKQDDDLPF